MISSLIPDIISENGTASLKLIIFEGKACSSYVTENPPWRRLCCALRNHPTALPALSVTQFAHAGGLDLSERSMVWSRCRCCAVLHRKGSSSVLFPSTKTWNEVSGKLLEVRVFGSIMLLWELRVLQASLRALVVWTKLLEVPSPPCTVLCFSTHHLEKLLFGWFPKGCCFLKSSCEFTLWKSVFLSAHLSFWGGLEGMEGGCDAE